LDAYLVAVSPQVPQRLEAVKRRHNLSCFIAADPRHALIDALNIGFASPGAATVLGPAARSCPSPRSSSPTAAAGSTTPTRTPTGRR
jgi:hypothetical protein